MTLFYRILALNLITYTQEVYVTKAVFPKQQEISQEK